MNASSTVYFFKLKSWLYVYNVYLLYVRLYNICWYMHLYGVFIRGVCRGHKRGRNALLPVHDPCRLRGVSVVVAGVIQ